MPIDTLSEHFRFFNDFCRKTQRTNAKSGRPKVADWKVAIFFEKIYGTFGVEMRAYAVFEPGIEKGETHVSPS